MSEIRFGSFSIGDGGLLRNDKPVALGQRGLALLVALAEADGAVGKQALMEAGWPGTVVEEGNLTVQIAALRKALGDRPDGGEWIVTVPRVGYRLARGDVASAVGAKTGLPVLAVLPFETIGGDVDSAAFADGLVEELVSALSRFKGFTLLARTAISRLRGTEGNVRGSAYQLGADYVVEGSVRRSGNQLRVAARLVVGVSGANAWSHTFDGTSNEGFGLQDRIAGVTSAQVSRMIRQSEVGRSTEQRPASGQAYDLMQRGILQLEVFSDLANRKGIALLEQAVTLEPERPLTLTMAAWGYEQRIHAGWTTRPGDEARCLELARAAIVRGGDDATVLGHCGIALQLCGGEWEHGLRTTLRGIEINPNSQTALMFAGVAHLKGGTLEGAREAFERSGAYAADDETGNPLAGVAHVLLCEGRFEEAEDVAERAVAMRPRFFWAHWVVIAANAQLGRMEAAHKALAIYRAADAGATLGRIARGQRSRDPDRHANLLEGLRLAGMPDG